MFNVKTRICNFDFHGYYFIVGLAVKSSLLLVYMQHLQWLFSESFEEIVSAFCSIFNFFLISDKKYTSIYQFIHALTWTFSTYIYAKCLLKS